MVPEAVIGFSAAAVALLGVPGPSNALVANAGITGGPRMLLSTVPAVFLGYAIVVIVLTAGLNAWLAAHPLISQVLRVICALYLVKVAYGLWRDAGLIADAATVPALGMAQFKQAFIVTLLNPKGLVGGLVLIPQFFAQTGGAVNIFVFVATFLAVASAITAGYTLAGSAIYSSGGSGRLKMIVSRASAVVILVFAAIIVFALK